MTKSTQDLSRLFNIADMLEVHERPYLEALRAFDESPSARNERSLDRATETYNETVIRYMPEIAAVTHNSASTLLGVFARGFGRLASEFLRNVATYGSFNEEYWVSQGWQGYRQTPNAESINTALGLRRSGARP